VGIGDGVQRMRGHWGGKPRLTGSDIYSSKGVGWWLTGHWVGESGLISSGPNHWRILCNSWWVADASLLMSLSACSRVRMQSGSTADGSSIISFRDISAKWKLRLAGERGFSEVASAEVEESNGSLKQPMVTA